VQVNKGVLRTKKKRLKLSGDRRIVNAVQAFLFFASAFIFIQFTG
jgi:hypothetical protein